MSGSVPLTDWVEWRWRSRVHFVCPSWMPLVDLRFGKEMTCIFVYPNTCFAAVEWATWIILRYIHIGDLELNVLEVTMSAAESRLCSVKCLTMLFLKMREKFSIGTFTFAASIPHPILLECASNTTKEFDSPLSVCDWPSQQWPQLRREISYSLGTSPLD